MRVMLLRSSLWISLVVAGGLLVAPESAPASPPPITEEALLLSPYGTFSYAMGRPIALDGNTLVVGSRTHTTTAQSDGAAFVYDRSPATGAWELAATLRSPTPAEYDFLGTSVAVDGDTIAVGATLDDEAGVDRGAVFVFERNLGGPGAWGLARVVTAREGAEGDTFGGSVALDGDLLLVGAPFADVGANGAGAGYLFERHFLGPHTWGQRSVLSAADPQQFAIVGTSVDLSGDVAVLGAPQHDVPGTFSSGAAYLFERVPGYPPTWVQTARLTASAPASDVRLGWSVAASTDRVAAGAYYDSEADVRAGAVHVFERGAGESGAWGQAAKLVAPDPHTDDHLGWSVDVDGDVVVAGAPDHDLGVQGHSPGAVYAFVRDAGSGAWSAEALLVAEDRSMGGQLGVAVAAADGRVAAGASRAVQIGAEAGAYVFAPGLSPPAAVPGLGLTLGLALAGLLAASGHAAKRRDRA